MERKITKLVNKFLKESFIDITDMDVEDAVNVVEYEMKEKEFKDNRKKIDVAEPKGKITADDFKKLRKDKASKKEVDEMFYFDNEDESEELSQNEPTYVGKGLKDNKMRNDAQNMFLGLDGYGWYDSNDYEYSGDFDFDYDEEEFDDFDDFYSKYGRSQKWFQKGPEGKRIFDTYKDKFGGPFKLRKRKPNRTPAGFEFGELVSEEGETQEGNAFSGALAKAKEEGKDSFEVDGKTYQVKESVNEKILRILEKRQQRIQEEKWIQDVDMKEGAFTKYCGGKVTCECVEKAMSKKGHPQKMAQMYLNMNKDKCKSLQENKSKNKLVFTESELINFIERIVEAETKEDKETTKSLKSSKSVNDKALSDTNKKMKDYMKNMGMSYESESKEFPKGNSIMSREGKDGKEITDDVKKAYKASKEIEEYIENFTAAGLENLDYDNIKPNEDWVSDNIEGSSRTGNSQEYANAIPSDVNKKLNDRRKKNLLAVLKRQAYNKSPQPVHTDEAGEVIPGTGEGIPSSKSGKRNAEVNRIMAAESVEDKKVLKDIEAMKNLIKYNQKTQ